MKPLISFILLLNVLTLFAQKEEIIRIQEVTITDSLNLNLNTFKINQKNPESIKSTGELMKKIPGVSLSKRSAFSIEPVINAFKYDQINTTLNGGIFGSSSCPNRMDPITTRITPDEITKIDFQRGPYEVKYGQVMGGFINIITDKNDFLDKFIEVIGKYNIALKYMGFPKEHSIKKLQGYKYE